MRLSLIYPLFHIPWFFFYFFLPIYYEWNERKVSWFAAAVTDA